jgi:hypothetical protein
VWAECVFANPVADIAVLGQPDNQALCEEADAYDELVEAAEPVAVADPLVTGPVWLLSLDGRWVRCFIPDRKPFKKHFPVPIWLKAEAPIEAGMSGSPIITDSGAAIGVICAGCLIGGRETLESGLNPRLTDQLPDGSCADSD